LCLKYTCLTLFFGWFFFLSPYWQKYCSFIPAGFFFALILTNIWQFCPSVLLTLSQYTYLKLSINILDTIESESTTRFKNRSSDRMITSDWLVDVSDDRYTTNKSLHLLGHFFNAERVVLLENRSVTIQNFYHNTYHDILDKWRYILWHFVYLCVHTIFFS
jgi:hypothetical protein